MIPAPSKSFRCRDMDEDCEFETSGETEQDVLDQVLQHARDRHSDIRIDEGTLNKIRSTIRDGAPKPQVA